MVQAQLERVASDVLFLIDACQAGGSVPNNLFPNFPVQHLKYPKPIEGGSKELIAACGFDRVAPGPIGSTSFTKALILTLLDMAEYGVAFSAAILHQQILARLLSQWKSHDSSSLLKSLLAPATPVRITLVESRAGPTIILKTFRQGFNRPRAHLAAPRLPRTTH